MKKGGLIILCLLLLVLAAGAGAAWFMLTPRGLLRSDLPEDMMQRLAEGTGRAGWRSEYIRLCAPVTTEFEDPAQVAGMIFDAAVPGNEFSFRAVPGSESEEAVSYILSAGDADLLRFDFSYAGSGWTYTVEGLDALSAGTRTLRITVPEDARVTLNGTQLGEAYVAERSIPYPDMSDLELRFAAYPTQVRYEVGGIYGQAEISAEQDGGLTALYADGTEWRYTLPDAGGYAFAVRAPAQAVVTVNGAVLSDDDVTATAAWSTRLTIPEELQGALPSYKIYAAGGLYTSPEITAALPDGTPLVPETAEDGSIRYALPPSQALYDACHGRVDTFLRALSEYGAGHTAGYAPGAYAVNGSEAGLYIVRALGSLYWTVGVGVTVNEISSSDYFALGENAFICRGHVDCTTKTKYQTRDLNVNYLMLWVKVGNNWMIQDLSYA